MIKRYVCEDGSYLALWDAADEGWSIVWFFPKDQRYGAALGEFREGREAASKMSESGWFWIALGVVVTVWVLLRIYKGPRDREANERIEAAFRKRAEKWFQENLPAAANERAVQSLTDSFRGMYIEGRREERRRG